VLQNNLAVQAWNGTRVVVADADSDEALAFSADEPTMILVHTPRHRESGCPEHPQQIGKECQRFAVTITVVRRTVVGVDPEMQAEPAIVGQPPVPGVVEMQTDVHAAFVGPTGAWNLLPDADGVDYVWSWEFGEAGDPLPIDDEDYTYDTSSREIVGHRWKLFY